MTTKHKKCTELLTTEELQKRRPVWMDTELRKSQEEVERGEVEEIEIDVNRGTYKVV